MSSPLDPQLTTQAESFEEAFENAYEVQAALTQIRAEMASEYLRATTVAQADKFAATQRELSNQAMSPA